MSDQILSVNSTRSGKISCTVLEESRGKHLQGSLCKVAIDTGHVDQTLLCRVGMINTVSPVHDSTDFAPIIAKRGSIKYISGDADIETAILDPISCIDDKGKISSRKANPPSGTPVMTLDKDDLPMFQQEKKYFFNAGYMPGYEDVIISLINRHYGEMAGRDGKDSGGWDEAKFRIYFGQSGSGKTIYLLEHCAARLAVHPGLGLLAIDTKGDLVVEGKHKGKPGFDFSFHDLLRDAGRRYKLISASDIRLTHYGKIVDHLSYVLKKQLGKDINILETALENVMLDILDGKDVDIDRLTLEMVINGLADMVNSGYGWSSTKGKEREEFVERIRSSAYNNHIVRSWENNIKPYYTGRYTAGDISEMVLTNGEIVLLDMAKARGGHEHQEQLVRELIRRIKSIAGSNYHKGRQMNAEIVLDEAPRWIPQERKDNKFADDIIDAVNTTRAYGVSWTFASQRITSIDKNALAQMHTKYYMKGLFANADMDNMESTIGKDGVELYRSLSLDGSYFCLVSGQELNFGSGTGFVALVGWDGDVNQKIKDHNPHIWEPNLWTSATI